MSRFGFSVGFTTSSAVPKLFLSTTERKNQNLTPNCRSFCPYDRSSPSRMTPFHRIQSRPPFSPLTALPSSVPSLLGGPPASFLLSWSRACLAPLLPYRQAAATVRILAWIGMSLLTVALAVKSDSVKNVRLVRRVLWPGSLPDPAVKAPLPPGSVGCPLAGVPFFWGDREYGAGSFYRTAARKLARRVELRKQREAPAPSVEGPSLSLIPSMFMYYFFGRPFAAVSGRSTLQKLLSLEFEPDGLRSAMRREGPSLMGSTSLITESDRRNHSFLRRLVGQALTPAAVAASVPVLQSASQVAVDQMLREGTGGSNNECSAPIYMDRVCTDFALDVAWRQILGLKSSPDEIPTFVQAVDDWVSGLASIRAILNVGIETSKAWRAKAYLERRVVEKIEDLERNGPDRKSTLSGMLFASDDEVENGGAGDPSSDEGGYRKLTRQQVIDNAMLLILAGSETSASTLTNAMAFLGLHRPVWEKLVDEQRRLQAMLGNELTKDALDRECPYLDAVIRETMRIRPVSGGVPRIAEETLVVNGQQIPKGWFIDWSAALSHELDPKTFQVDGSHMDIIKGFKPERWLSEETAPVDYVPMGAGPRYCLGSVLAYTEMKVFLATLARSIDFELVRDPVDSMRDLRWKRTSIIPKLESGVPIRVRARNPNPVTAR